MPAVPGCRRMKDGDGGQGPSKPTPSHTTRTWIVQDSVKPRPSWVKIREGEGPKLQETTCQVKEAPLTKGGTAGPVSNIELMNSHSQ